MAWKRRRIWRRKLGRRESVYMQERTHEDGKGIRKEVCKTKSTRKMKLINTRKNGTRNGRNDCVY